MFDERYREQVQEFHVRFTCRAKLSHIFLATLQGYGLLLFDPFEYPEDGLFVGCTSHLEIRSVFLIDSYPEVRSVFLIDSGLTFFLIKQKTISNCFFFCIKFFPACSNCSYFVKLII